MNKWHVIEESLQTLKDNNLYRTMNVIESPQNSHVMLNGKDMMMLSSNAYLDFCNEEYIKTYSKKVLQKYGTGSGGSRLTTGTTDIHVKLEEELAHFKNREAALVFSTGYAANLGIISSICHEGDVIFSDELNHASIIDGCRQSKAKVVIYKHNDMEDLEQKIKNTKYNNGLIVSDAVFSMDGDIVNLPEFINLAEEYDLFSMIDEAHATGVIGKTGKGTEEYFHMEGKTDIIMGTLSKAFGSEGGYVCGSRILIDYLINKARSFIFSTSLSPVTVASALSAIKLLEKDSSRVIALQENIAYFCNCLQSKGLNVHSETAIIPIYIGDEKKALNVSNLLMEKGYFIPAIRYPTVKKGEAILRVALMSSHTKEELKEASDVIYKVITTE
jgi:6-carboxyhexanoate--CoA ligase